MSFLDAAWVLKPLTWRKRAQNRQIRLTFAGIHRIDAIGWIAFALVFSALIAAPSRACLPIGRNGSPVEVAEETAVILWDAAAKTEHFIRRARFLSDAKDIGFLVPTPTKPELIEVDNSLFDELWRFTNPPPPDNAPRSRGAVPAPTLLPKADPVQVLETKTVAGLDATILAASDAKALTEWLKKNEYPTTPETEAWLAPYLKDQWIITAYKVDNTGGASGQWPKFQTSTVRMSFKADKPFYPYREPQQAGKQGAGKNSRERLLRVYFLSQEAHEAELLENRWETTIPFADRITPVLQERLKSLLKLPKSDTTSVPWFLTEFEDRATARKPGGEIVFVPRADMTVRTRMPASTMGFSTGSGSGSLNAIDREAMRNLIPVGMALVALVVFTGWIVWKKRGSAPI